MLTSRCALILGITHMLACGQPLDPAGENPSLQTEPYASIRAAVSGPGTSLNGTNLGKGLRVFPNGWGTRAPLDARCGLAQAKNKAGIPIKNVVLVNTTLHGNLDDGRDTHISGTEFVDAELCAELGAPFGDEKTIVIKSITTGTYMLNYVLEFKKPGGSEAVCPTDPLTGTQYKAWPIAGDWTSKSRDTSRPDVFTFACHTGAIAKCLKDQKYLPWTSTTDDSVFLACARMLRADYCGTGESFTRNGVRIQFKRVGESYPPSGAPWEKEAIWGPTGAVCMDNWRDTRPSCTLPSCSGITLQPGQLQSQIPGIAPTPDPTRCKPEGGVLGEDCL